MRRTIQAGAVALTAATLAGYTSATNDADDPQRTTSLVGHWRLTALTDRGKPVPLVGATDATVDFDRNGRSTMDDGTNTTGGTTYTTAADRIAFDQGYASAVGYIPGTPGYTVGQAFADIGDSVRFAVVDESLTLRTGRYVLGFERA